MSSKKGPLSKKEKSYILKNYHNMTATIMADKLDRSVHVVDKFIAKMSFAADETADETANEAVEEPAVEEEVKPVSNLYARKEDRGVTIMTEAASMASDENKSKAANSVPRYSKFIHKIK